jgi:hypothetical protein
MHFYVAIAYCLGAGNYRPLMHLPASDILDGCVAHPGVRAVVNLFFWSLPWPRWVNSDAKPFTLLSVGKASRLHRVDGGGLMRSRASV